MSKEKEKKDKNKKFIIGGIVIIGVLLLIIGFLIIKMNKGYTITFDSDGGTPITGMEVKNGEITKLPDNPKKEGFVFTGWVNKENYAITNGVKITEDLTLKAVWVDEKVETVNANFTIDEEKPITIIIEKNKEIRFPIPPIKDGYIFVGWSNEEENIVQKDSIVTEDTKLTAIWIKKGVKTVDVSFNTDGGNNINNIIIEKGKIIRFPVAPIKDGFVFAGWIDENGKEITKDTIVNNNITLKAVWKSYTCPDECTPIGNGSTCSKTTTTKVIPKSSCPDGYKLKDGKCLDLANKYYAEFIDVEPWNVCKGNDYKWVEVFGLGAEVWCAKQVNISSVDTCPDGYTLKEKSCKKTETLNCSLN